MFTPVCDTLYPAGHDLQFGVPADDISASVDPVGCHERCVPFPGVQQSFELVQRTGQNTGRSFRVSHEEFMLTTKYSRVITLKGSPWKQFRRVFLQL